MAYGLKASSCDPLKVNLRGSGYIMKTKIKCVIFKSDHASSSWGILKNNWNLIHIRWLGYIYPTSSLYKNVVFNFLSYTCDYNTDTTHMQALSFQL